MFMFFKFKNQKKNERSNTKLMLKGKNLKKYPFYFHDKLALFSNKMFALNLF